MLSESKSSEVLNIKKRSASDIFWGEYTATGQMLHINNAKRGLQCGCVCALCRRPLIARQGEVRHPHFAHQSNYDCFYSNEVAIYKVVAEILGESGKIMLPSIVLSFPSWNEKETLQEQSILPIDGPPDYQCEETQYPPDLIVTIRGKQLRIILDFGRYYDEHDISELRENEKKRGNACVRYRFPECSGDDFFSKEHLKTVLEQGDGIVWVYSPLENLWRQRYLAKAQNLPLVKGRIDCPLHKEKMENRYCVSFSTCLKCRYNVSENNSCLCLGGGGYEHTKDFYADNATLFEKVTRIRAENEAQIQRKEEQELERLRIEAELEKQRQQQEAEKERRLQRWKEVNERKRSQWEAEKERLRQQEQTDLEKRRQEMRTVSSKFGQGRIRCKICGIIKPKDEMALYDNRDNTGVCSICARTLT